MGEYHSYALRDVLCSLQVDLSNHSSFPPQGASHRHEDEWLCVLVCMYATRDEVLHFNQSLNVPNDPSFE